MVEIKPVATPLPGEKTFGGQSMTGALKRVMARRAAATAESGVLESFGYGHPVEHQQALQLGMGKPVGMR